MEPTTEHGTVDVPPMRIPRYVVLRHGHGLVAVRTDWSWPGFLLPWAWPLLQRLWWLGLPLTTCLAVMYGLYLADGRAGTLYVALLVDGIARLVAGMCSNGLNLRRLRRAGWLDVAQVRAISAEDAVATAHIRGLDLG